MEDIIVAFVRDQLKLNSSSTRSQVLVPRKSGELGILKPSTMYHAKRTSFLLSVLNSDDQHVRAVARGSFDLHMQKRKVTLYDTEDEDEFGKYKVDEDYRILKQSKINWTRSTFVELNELCRRLGVRLNFEEHTDRYSVAVPASEDGVVNFTFTDHRQLYSAIKRMEVDKDIRHFAELQQQGRLQREALPAADMSCSLGHLTVGSLSDNIARFAAKGRLQLLETNAMNRTYYPETYPGHCTLCGFHTDTNSHALNGCSALRGLYTERHNRCVQLIKEQLETNISTDSVQIYDGEVVKIGGMPVLDRCKPDLCIIDNAHKKAFIVEVSNPFDAFLQECFDHKFQKYLPLCFALADAGFESKIVVLIIGALGTVHKKVVTGLRMLGLSTRQSKSLARYLSVSVIIGSGRAWTRRGYLLSRMELSQPQ